MAFRTSFLRRSGGMVAAQQNLSMHLRIDRPCSSPDRACSCGVKVTSTLLTMIRATSRCKDSTSRTSRSKLCDQMISPVAPLISLAVIRTMSLARTTEPSMIASTRNSRAMVGTGFRALL